MINVVGLLFHFFLSFFRTRADLSPEITVLRQQPIVARRRAPPRPFFTNLGRLILICLCRLLRNR